MKKITFSNEDKNKIIKLSNQGLTLTEIIATMQLKCSRSTVSRLLNKNLDKVQYKGRRIVLSKDQKEEIIKLSNSGVSASGVVDKMELKCSVDTIYSFLRRNAGELNGNQFNKSHSCNKRFFSRIDTEKKAYWLGFLYADGNVHKRTVSVTVASRDISHLRKFRDDLSSTHPINTREQDSWGTTTEISRLSVYSVEMCRDLIALGCMPRKSNILSFPTKEQVPDHLVRHFIRGYIDGDGSISESKDKKVYNVGILGTFHMIKNIKEHLALNAEVRTEPRANGVFYINFGGNLQVLEKLNYLYKDATVYLERKYNTYMKLKNKYPQELIEERKNLSSRFR